MNGETKIALSGKELEMVCDTDWILTKHAIIEKVYQLFGEVASSMQVLVQENKAKLPGNVTNSTPKISKGENYRQLPYVMLDYPRHFSKEDTVAVRTLFWWGNFFSINLQLSGESKNKIAPNLATWFKFLQDQQYWICIHEDPWQHYFSDGNYRLLQQCSVEEFNSILYNSPFIKIAKRLPLSEWDNAARFINGTFKEMIEVLEINYRADERGPSPGIPITGSGL
jgi:hypothetical protein